MPAKTISPTRRTRASTPSGSRGDPVDRQAGRKLPVITADALDAFTESNNILLFGPPGSWKTATAGMAPRATFLSTEKGVVAAQRFGSQAKVLRAPDWDFVEAGLNWADENLVAGDWLIIDSLTKMQVFLMRWLLQNANIESDGARDLDIPAIQDHQKWQNMFKRFVDRIIDAPYNSIFICTDMLVEDADGEDIRIPEIQGKAKEGYAISGYITAQMDMVLHISSRNPEDREDEDEDSVHRIVTESWGEFRWCKDRYDCLPRFINIPAGRKDVMPKIISLIENSDTVSNDGKGKGKGKKPGSARRRERASAQS